MRPPSVRQRVVALCCANGARPPHSMCKHKQMSGFAIQVGRAGVPCGNCGDRGDTVQPSSELLEAFDSLTGSHRVFRRLFWMFFNRLFTTSSRNTKPKVFQLRQSFISFGTLLVFLWVREKKTQSSWPWRWISEVSQPFVMSQNFNKIQMKPKKRG